MKHRIVDVAEHQRRQYWIPVLQTLCHESLHGPCVPGVDGRHHLEDPEGAVRQARLLSAQLPIKLRRSLIDFERVGDGAFLVCGLEVGAVGATPENPDNDVTHPTEMAKSTSLILSVLAHLVSYRAESWGRICQCLVPTRAARRMQTSTGWGVCLECHTEQAFNLLTRPDFIALGCLRGDPHAITYVMSARTLQRHLPSWAVELLYEARFLTRVDQSFVTGGVPDTIRGPIAVLTGPTDDPVITYDEDLMYSESPDHQRALDLIKEIWVAIRSCVVLQRGSVIVLDNSRAVHGRSAFSPRFDGSDRWVARFQGVTGLAMTRHARKPGSPVIEIPGC